MRRSGEMSGTGDLASGQWDEAVEVEGVGTLDFFFFTWISCAVDHAGWTWYADGGDADQARAHLRQRLVAHDPTYGGRDLGPFGTSGDATVDGLDRSFFSPETIDKLELYLMESGFPPA